MNFALFGFVRIGNKQTARSPKQEQCAQDLHATWDQRFDRLSTLLAELAEN